MTTNKDNLPANQLTLRHATVSRTLGRRLRYLRGQLGVSQETVAQNIGTERSHIGKLERGELMPRLSTLMRLAGYFAVEVSFLVGSGSQTLDK